MIRWLKKFLKNLKARLSGSKSNNKAEFKIDAFEQDDDADLTSAIGNAPKKGADCPPADAGLAAGRETILENNGNLTGVSDLSFNLNEHEIEVKEYYNSFNLNSFTPSNLTFYKNIKKLYPAIKIPDNAAKSTFGCLNPITYVLEDIYIQKKNIDHEYSIMDIGGGSGFDVFLMKQIMKKSRYLNIDLSHNLLKNGLKIFKNELNDDVNCGDGKVSFVCGSLSKLPVKENYCADYIISNAVLNLIGDKDALFGNLCNILKNDGSLILCDISYEGNCGKNAGLSGKKVTDGTYFAPTIINEEEYKIIIFKHFNYCHVLERHEINPCLKELEGTAFAVNAYLIKKNPPGDHTEIECEGCGEKLPIIIYQNVSPDDAPIFLAMIETGILNTAVCRKCKKVYTDFAPYFFSWPSKNIYYHVFPEALKNRRKEFELQIKYLPGYENNPGLIFGYGELKKFLERKNLL